MRRTKYLTIAAASLASAAALASACTGDEPTLTPEAADAGGDGSTPNPPPPPPPPSGQDAGDAGSDAPFTPSDFGTRLVLWYEASPSNFVLDDAGNGTVVQWNDLSTSHLAAKLLTTDKNAAGGMTPLVDDGGATPRNVLHVDRWNEKLGDESGQPNLEFGGRDFLVEMVLSMNSGSTTVDVPLFDRHETFGHLGSLAMYAGQGHIKVDITPDDPDAASYQELVSQNAVLDDDGYHVVAMRRIHQPALAKDTIQIRIDGVHEEMAFDPVDLDLASANFWFGGDYHGIGPLYGYDVRIAEVIVIAAKTSTPVSDDDAKAVEAYLKAKYATP